VIDGFLVSHQLVIIGYFGLLQGITCEFHNIKAQK